MIKGGEVGNHVWECQQRILYEKHTLRGRNLDVAWMFVNTGSRSKDKMLRRGEPWLAINDTPPSIDPPDPPTPTKPAKNTISQVPAVAETDGKKSEDERRDGEVSSNVKSDGQVWYSMPLKEGLRKAAKSTEHVISAKKVRKSALKSFDSMPVDGRHVMQ